eukprot:1990065-Rhodomonas_salina.1
MATDSKYCFQQGPSGFAMKGEEERGRDECVCVKEKVRTRAERRRGEREGRREGERREGRGKSAAVEERRGEEGGKR